MRIERELVCLLTSLVLCSCSSIDTGTDADDMANRKQGILASKNRNPPLQGTPAIPHEGTLQFVTYPANGPDPTLGSGLVLGGDVPIFLIWYGDWGNSPAPNIVPDFVQALSGSTYMGISAGYYDNAGDVVSGISHLGGQATVPADVQQQLGSTLTQGAIGYAISRTVDATSLPVEPRAIYIFLTAPGVTFSDESGDTFGPGGSICGFHYPLQMRQHQGKSPVAVVGDASGNPSVGCAPLQNQTLSPNGDVGTDAMLSIIAHEVNESLTDSHLGNGAAWVANVGGFQYEIGDMCAWEFGIPGETHYSHTWVYSAPNGSSANIRLGSRDYLIQEIWKLHSGCRMEP
jgi:hypothetical protein